MNEALVIGYVKDVNALRLRRLAHQLSNTATAIICADSGAEAALAWGLRPTLVLGDMDSIAPATLAQLRLEDMSIQEYPAEKDETDIELALRAAVESGATRITILGGIGGRLDHTLGNIFLLAAAWIADAQIRIEAEEERIAVVRAGETLIIEGMAGETVSLFPLTSIVEGIRTDGLYYPLADESLFLGPSRGVSNLLLGGQATVYITTGLLLVVQQVSV